MEELRVDMRKRTPEEYMSVLKELFGDRIGEGSYLAAPVNGAAMEKLAVGSPARVINRCVPWRSP